LSCQGFHELRRVELVLPLTGCFVQFVTCVYPPALGNGLGKSSRIPILYPFYELTVSTPINDVQILLLSADLFLSDKQHRPYCESCICYGFRSAVVLWYAALIPVTGRFFLQIYPEIPPVPRRFCLARAIVNLCINHCITNSGCNKLGVYCNKLGVYCNKLGA